MKSAEELTSDARWRRWHSIYLLWAIPALGFVALLYTGIRGRRWRWVIWGTLYAVLVIGASAFLPEDEESTESNLLGLVLLVAWIGSAAQLFVYRMDWLGQKALQHAATAHASNWKPTPAPVRRATWGDPPTGATSATAGRARGPQMADDQRSEAAWWLASDGRWYPPEAKPGGVWNAAEQRWNATPPVPPPRARPADETSLWTAIGLCTGLSLFVAFGGFFSGQNGDPEETIFGLYLFPVALGLAVAGFVAGVRATVFPYRGERSSQRLGGDLPLLVALGLPTILLLGVPIAVVANGTWAGIEVDRAGIGAWFASAVSGGAAVGLLVSPKTRGRPSAVAAQVFAGIAVSVAVIGQATGSEEVPHTREAVASVRVADCVDANFRRVVLRVTSCRAPHDAEVFGIIEHKAEAGAAYPGWGQLLATGEEACARPFADYVGLDSEASDLEPVVLPPTEGEWRAGSRRLVCVARLEDRTKLARSVRDSEL